jgi:hypothetical protein
MLNSGAWAIRMFICDGFWSYRHYYTPYYIYDRLALRQFCNTENPVPQEP